MAKRTTKKNVAETNNVRDYRHSSKRKNIPEAGIAVKVIDPRGNEVMRVMRLSYS